MPQISSELNREQRAWNATTPHTSLLIACYGVEQYLPDFLASLEAQTADHSGTELIFVIDGSPDNSESVVRAWMAGTDYAVQLVSQPNGGVASARNAALERARGRWISAPDPDDVLEPEYLSEIERARASHPDERMFVGRIQVKSPEGEDLPHALDFKFFGGRTRVIDLMREPEAIQTPGGNVFLDREAIESLALRYDVRLRQASDSLFIAHYLLGTSPRHVVVPSAVYEYRRRADGTSIVAQQQRRIIGFDEVFAGPHRELLRASERVTAPAGSPAAASPAAPAPVPQWIANVVLHLSYIVFQRNFSEDSPTYRMAYDELERLRSAFVANLRLIGAEAVRGFRAGFPLPIEVRSAWLAALGELHASSVLIRGIDGVSECQRLSIFSGSAEPPAGLRAVAPGADILETKTRRIEFLGSAWGYEHLLRVSGTAPARLSCDDGFSLELRGEAVWEDDARQRLGHVVDPLPARPRLGVAARLRRAARLPLSAWRSAAVRRLRSDRVRRLKYAALWRLAGVSGFRARAAGAWIFTDAGSARGNAEAVFRRARKSHPSINAWFVEERAAARRSHSARGRVVVSGTWRHFVLAKQARVVISSALEPLDHTPFPESAVARGWRRVFVNPDVFSGMEYRRTNPLDIDLVTTSTVSEFERLERHGGDFAFFRSQLIASGMPRHDDLLARAVRNTDSLVIAPSRRRLEVPTQLWADSWSALLASPQLHRIASEMRLRVRWVHPGGRMPVLAVPDWIDEVTDPVEADGYIAGASALVTDYSSRSYDAAVCGVSTVFFQFDRELVLGAEGSLRDASFDAFHSGFGPLAFTVESVLEELPTLIGNHGDDPGAGFLAWDRGASERVIAAVDRLLQRSES